MPTSSCRRCHQDLLEGTRFCTNCGEAVQDEPKLAKATGYLNDCDRQEIFGDRRVVTVIFTDMSGFTSMSETNDPEKILDILNAFFRVLTEPVYRYGGVVDKYIGDAVMALFGAPVGHEDDPERALWAAWEMQQVAKQFAKQFAKRLHARTGMTLRIRIGLNTGLVVAGNVGGEAKQAYTVMGDTVNLAQRMEANAAIGSILLTEETQKLAAHRFLFAEQAPIRVKGRSQNVRCFELLGPASSHGADRIKVVGRLIERQALRECWDVALAGSPPAICLEGPAGSGKSALVYGFLDELPSGTAAVKAGSNSYEVQVPLHLATAVLRAALGLEGVRGTPAELETALWRVSPRKAGDPEARFLLGTLLGHDLPKELGALAPEFMRPMVFRHLDDLMVERARWEQFVLVCDDLQWVDESSRQWLGGLLRALEDETCGKLQMASRSARLTSRSAAQRTRMSGCSGAASTR